MKLPFLFLASGLLVGQTAFGQDNRTLLFDDIGATEWVNPTTIGQLPESAARAIEHAHPIRLKEKINTDKLGASDFSFYNRSRLLVGTLCEVTLDERYYDQELKIEVKDFSLYSETRCVAKADTSNALSSAAIILKTPLAEIRVENATAYVQFQKPAAARRERDTRRGGGGGSGSGSGSDDRGDGADYDAYYADDAIIVVGKEGDSGRITISTNTAGSTFIDRDGYYVAVLGNGQVIAPQRITVDIGKQFSSGLESQGSLSGNGARLPGGSTLISPILGPRSPTLPRSCILDECRVDVIDVGNLVPLKVERPEKVKKPGIHRDPKFKPNGKRIHGSKRGAHHKGKAHRRSDPY